MAMNNFPMDAAPEMIAIIGMSGRFPGAANLADFWQNLLLGVESIRVFSDEELLTAETDPEMLRRPAFVRANGFLADIEQFDSSFFGYNPFEASLLDPQFRLFLECSVESLESAGYDPNRFPGLIGVFAGCSASSYLYQLYSSNQLLDPIQVALATDKDHLATQTAYKLNLKGPGITVQSACSTSLVAVSVACQALIDFQCDMALAGGSSVSSSQVKGYLYEEGGILSPDGHCRPFDADAHGTVTGSGVGVVLLKRLSDAMADNDTILAVVRGWAVNNDGSLKVSYTAPSIAGQAAAISMAYASAGVDPSTVSFIETHGTGTAMGDPIEVAALTEVFRAFTPLSGYCALGSVKSNIGHLDAAAGIAGLIKTILALQHHSIPPSPYFRQPNPNIDLASSPFYVNADPVKWTSNGVPRRAGVSSFGMGGTNVHVVLEEAPPPVHSGPSRANHLLLASAQSDQALEQATSNLAQHLREHPDLSLADVAYTGQVGRGMYAKRRFVVCSSVEEAITSLQTGDGIAVNGLAPASDPAVAFLFPGQGSQHVDMLRGIHEEEAVFREHLERCAGILQPLLGLDIRNLLWPTDAMRERAAEQLNKTALAQPALFVVEYALAQLWLHWGIQPRAMIGHSIGEYVAACLAGVMTLEDALWLVAQRGHLMGSTPSGAMLSVACSEQDLAPLLGDRLALAAVNGPFACVVAGELEVVEQAAQRLAAAGVTTRRLHTSHAFHSSMMEPVLADFLVCVQTVPLQSPSVPYLSNVTGDWVSVQDVVDPHYWVTQLRHTVRFGDSLERLLGAGNTLLLEVGPGTALSSLCRSRRPGMPVPTVISSARHPDDPQSDSQTIAGALGRLWVHGVSIDWTSYHAHETRRRVPLPTYPFQRRRHWMDAAPARPQFASPGRRALEDWFLATSWRPAVRGSLLDASIRSTAPRRWWLFANDDDLSRELAKSLRHEGHEAIIVLPGTHLENVRPDQYRLRPAERADFAALFAERTNLSGLPEVFLHLWTRTATPEDGDYLDQMQSLGFYSLLALAQALGGRTSSGGQASVRIHIGVVSNFLHKTADRDVVCPPKALVLGPATVISQEYPDIFCRTVDVPLETGREAERARLLMAEFLQEPEADQVAYRDGQRWIRDFQGVRLLPRATQDHPRLRSRGVYLITGGLGGIGLAIGEHLALHFQARLVLLGRTPMPTREEWARQAAGQGPVAERIRSLQRMEEAGAEVMTVSADVGDAGQMKQALQAALARFGEIHGVVHSAGVPGGGVIELKTREIAEQIFLPKVRGTLLLYSLVSGLPLDFFVVCSSLASILGGAGQVDYCAANNFLDAFAQRYSGPFPVVSINWDAWREVGMAVNTEVPAAMQAMRYEINARGIAPQEGADAFERILCTRLAQVAVCTSSLESLLEPQNDWPPDSLDETLSSSAVRFERPGIATPFVEPESPLERQIAALWESILNISPVGRHDSFFELGGHSLIAVQFLSRLRNTVSCSLSIQDMFQAPTPQKFAAKIESNSALREEGDEFERLLEQVENLSDEQTRALLQDQSKTSPARGTD
jgi:acyl transferase domain-containing protein